MGRAVRERLKRLPEKLLSVREWLGLSQNEMLDRMGLTGELNQSDISRYESGRREPSLRQLLLYAKTISGRGEAGKYLEMLIDDDLDLKLPRRPPARTGLSMKGRGRQASKKRTGR
jgi:transcriptional regulator with XRE-family HTH domain